MAPLCPLGSWTRLSTNAALIALSPGSKPAEVEEKSPSATSTRPMAPTSPSSRPTALNPIIQCLTSSECKKEDMPEPKLLMDNEFELSLPPAVTCQHSAAPAMQLNFGKRGAPMLSTEKKKFCEAAELGELATEQQNLHRQQIRLQQHLELSLVKERRQVDSLQSNVSDVWTQLEIQGDVNKLVMNRLEMLKADLTREKTTRLQLQELAKANQITLKRLQTAPAIKNSLQKCKYCPMPVNTKRWKLCKPCFVKNAKASGAKSRGNQLAKRKGKREASGFAGCWCPVPSQPSQLQRIRRMMVPSPKSACHPRPSSSSLQG